VGRSAGGMKQECGDTRHKRMQAVSLDVDTTKGRLRLAGPSLSLPADSGFCRPRESFHCNSIDVRFLKGIEEWS
jgi:hypothetical protein